MKDYYDYARFYAHFYRQLVERGLTEFTRQDFTMLARQYDLPLLEKDVVALENYLHPGNSVKEVIERGWRI